MLRTSERFRNKRALFHLPAFETVKVAHRLLQSNYIAVSSKIIYATILLIDKVS